ncbi:MAG: hypothetical protein U1E23_17085 [Reyranellaceae bacterium]
MPTRISVRPSRKARPAALLGLLVAATLAATLAACAAGSGGVIGGAYYAPQYSWSEFFAATDGRNFQVVEDGNPFPALPADEVRRRLLPVMQANKPRPNLTFTYRPPPEPPRPDYRLVLVFDAGLDLTADRVCAGQVWHNPRPTRPFDLFAVYCRNDQVMSYTTAWTPADGPDDPRVGQLFAQLFLVLFPDYPLFRRGPLRGALRP